jgi:hypothetical protein
MSTLTGTIIANTYKQLLQVGTGNVGLTSSLQTVQDGDAANSPLQLSNSAVNINGTFQLNGTNLDTTINTISASISVNAAAITSINAIIGDGGNYATSAELAATSLALATSIGTANTRITSVSNFAVALSATMATSIGTANTRITSVSDFAVALSATMATSIGNSNTNIAAVSVLTSINAAAITSVSNFAVALSATMATSIGNSNTTIAAVSVLTSVNLAAITSITAINTQDVTLAGTPDYITISNQVITRNQVDLAADVTGNLPVGNLNSGTGASGTSFWRGDGTWSTPSGAGDVVGPASSTDNAITRFDSTTGKLLQNSTATLSDTGDITATSLNGILGSGTPAAATVTTLTASGVTTVQAGTALLPSIVPTGDTNTGVWFPAADTVAASTAGTERMRIDSSGNVGIGTTAPSSILEISGAGDDTNVIVMSQGGNYKNSIQNSHSGSASNARMSFFVHDSSTTQANVMSLLGSGNVGIGTTSPARNLTVNGSIQFTSGGVIEAGTTTLNTYIAGVEGASGRWVFATNGSERMRIDSSGNVGIGTTSPTEKLDVVGNVTISGSLTKGSGSFKIDHPLKPDTHHLVHSFVEAPTADNIYRGSVDLVDGVATVDLDEAARLSGGTFVALNTNTDCWVNNKTGWTAVRATVSGSTLSIEAQDNSCADTVSWLVIGERHDQTMIDATWTDEAGRVITEPQKDK